MSKLNRANINKTIYYLKRNGIKKTVYAVLERLEERRQSPYKWEPIGEKELEAQRQTVKAWEKQDILPVFSILVPTYRTKEAYLRELVESLLNQTYPEWELILADATEDDSVEQVVQTYTDSRIRYTRLARNAGISENTNQALVLATGEYVGLLDHDDVLTPDALYEMAKAIHDRKEQYGDEPWMLYSDEDKCNSDMTHYYEPNFKEAFNLDLLLSNNYICHFLVMKREMMQQLKFRPEYDGAQDHDLVLRAAAYLREKKGCDQGCGGAACDLVRMRNGEHLIAHVPKVLYHWRCHSASTAENPQSKLYAYESGRRAIQDFVEKAGWKARAVETAHVGFFTLEYEKSIFAQRPDVGLYGGNLVRRGKIVSGRLDKAGKCLYENLSIHYSGYLHRAKLSQDACAVDIRNICVREECRQLFEKITGVTYAEKSGTGVFDAFLLPENCDYVALSLQLCEAARQAGYRVLYRPEIPTRRL